MEKIYDIVIIGGGPAGLTAALYGMRANKSVLVIDKEACGGQIQNSPKVENYPTQSSISGADLVGLMQDQLYEGDSVDFKLMRKVISVDSIDGIFCLKSEDSDGNLDNEEILGRSVIFANGVKHRELNIPGAAKLVGHGVYFCAICDGPIYKDKDVVLIGDGNSAMQYALLLAGYCRKVTVVRMTDKFFGEEALKKAITNASNIEVIDFFQAVEVLGDNHVSGVKFTNGNEEMTIKTEALFVAIGQVPDNGNFKNIVDLDQFGYIIGDSNCHTKTDGVFVAGDCRVKKIRQVATAVGDGATAASEAVNYLNTK